MSWTLIQFTYWGSHILGRVFDLMCLLNQENRSRHMHYEYMGPSQADKSNVPDPIQSNWFGFFLLFGFNLNQTEQTRSRLVRVMGLLLANPMTWVSTCTDINFFFFCFLKVLIYHLSTCVCSERKAESHHHMLHSALSPPCYLLLCGVVPSNEHLHVPVRYFSSFLVYGLISLQTLFVLSFSLWTSDFWFWYMRFLSTTLMFLSLLTNYLRCLTR